MPYRRMRAGVEASHAYARSRGVVNRLDARLPRALPRGSPSSPLEKSVSAVPEAVVPEAPAADAPGPDPVSIQAAPFDVAAEIARLSAETVPRAHEHVTFP